MVNDVWGLQGDTTMADTIASFGVPVIVMHNRTEVDPQIDIIEDIKAFFDRSLEIAANAGISTEKVVLDPGIGFGKTHDEQSMSALARLADLQTFGRPLLVGASRKRFIASVVASEPDQRIGGSLPPT